MAIALDPQNPDIVYDGTSNYFYGALGILQSTDAGGSWTRLPGPGPAAYPTYASGYAAPSIWSLTVSPSNSRILLAGIAYGSATGQGINRTNDGGATWTKVLAGDLGTGVFFDPHDGNTAYAVTSRGPYAAAGVSASLYKSRDAGVTWSQINGTDSNAIPLVKAGYIGLTIAPSNTSILYAQVANETDGSLIGLYKSVDAG